MVTVHMHLGATVTLVKKVMFWGSGFEDFVKIRIDGYSYVPL
jgi:hypothetical protein